MCERSCQCTADVSRAPPSAYFVACRCPQFSTFSATSLSTRRHRCMPRYSITLYRGRCAVHGGRSAIGMAFSYNKNITTFHEFENFTKVDMVYMRAFYNSSLTGITLPHSIKTLKMECFRLATSLPNLTLPAFVTTIENMSLYQNDGLRTLTCFGTTPPSIEGTNGLPSTCQIYVPASAVETYKQATWWSNYVSSIQPIPE